MLRTSPVLDALFTRTKQQILTVTLLQPHHAWYLLELAGHLRIRPSSLQRDLRALTEAGILKRRENGRRVYFQADTACPIFRELAQILFKTAAVADALRAALESLKTHIRVTLIYGSVAASAERSTSDIDLLIVGSVELSAVAPVLRDLERRLGRPINPMIYTPGEFARRLSRGDHFVNTILREEKLWIIGTEDELAKLASSGKDQATPHEQARDRGSTRRRRTRSTGC